MTHLDALELRLSNERIRLSASKTEAERKARTVTVAQCQKEVDGERRFVATTPRISDDEILAELGLAE